MEKEELLTKISEIKKLNKEMSERGSKIKKTIVENEKAQKQSREREKYKNCLKKAVKKIPKIEKKLEKSKIHLDKSELMIQENDFKNSKKEIMISGRLFKSSLNKLDKVSRVINEDPSPFKILSKKINDRFKENNTPKNILLSFFVAFLGMFLTLFLYLSWKIFNFFNGSIELVFGVLLLVMVGWILFIASVKIKHHYRKIITSIALTALIILAPTKILDSGNVLFQIIIVFGAVLPSLWFFMSIKKEEQYSFWLIGTILIMVVTLSIGFLLLYGLYSDATIELRLNVGGDVHQRYGMITCEGLNKIKDGSGNINCNIEPNQEHSLYKIISYNITVTDYNLIQTTYQGEDEISFSVPPTETKDFYFESEIFEGEKTNKTIISTYHTQEIHTAEYWKDKDKEFLRYLYYLATAVFFSIPLMMINLRKLSKIKKK